MSETPWFKISETEPKDGETVRTKIDDAYGARNEQRLRRQGRLWFVPDGQMYVYYTPTHFTRDEKVG